jgi:hypothetical protein
MIQPKLTINDFTDRFNQAVKSFKNDAVLVGIPEEENRRDEDAPIGNAAILAINNFGSPANNIPARPVMEIGIKAAQEKIAEQFKVAAQTVFKKGTTALSDYYERAGIIASQSIKKVINDQIGIDPPADSTLRARKYLTKSGFKGTKALVVTGQLRNAITYVVQSIWGK